MLTVTAPLPEPPAGVTLTNGLTVLTSHSAVSHPVGDAVTVITKGGFSATIQPTFNYSPKVETIDDMYKNLRLDLKDIEMGWLKTAIIGSIGPLALPMPQ